VAEKVRLAVIKRICVRELERVGRAPAANHDDISSAAQLAEMLEAVEREERNRRLSEQRARHWILPRGSARHG